MKHALISRLVELYGAGWRIAFAQLPQSRSKEWILKQIEDEYCDWAEEFYAVVASKGPSAADAHDPAFAAAVAVSHDLEKSVTLTCLVLAGMPSAYIEEQCGVECHVVTLRRNLFLDTQVIENRYDLLDRGVIAPELHAGNQTVAEKMRFACIGGETAAQAITGTIGFAPPDDRELYAQEEVNELYSRFLESHAALAALAHRTDDLLKSHDFDCAASEVAKLERQREEYRAKIWGRQSWNAGPAANEIYSRLRN